MRTSAAYSYLAKLFQEYKQVDSAAIYIQKALIASAEAFHNPSIHANPDISKIAEPYALFELFSDKGTILLDLYHERPNDLKVLTTSMECFKISDVLMELNRSAYHQDGTKLFFADHYHHIYESALEAAYVLFNKTQQRDHLADAATFMEKGKAILLAESLNKAEIFTSAGLPDSVREMEKNLNTALATYRSQLETVNQKPNSEAAERIQAQIFDISQKQERLLDTIARLYPNYFQVKYQKISSLSDIQNFAKENDATIIEYFWGEEKIYALAISGEELVFKQVTHADSLTQNIREYFQSIRQLPSWKENNLSFQNFFKSSHQIYKILVGPLLENSDNERIIIIRDGPLLHIPFESLPVSTANSQENSYQKLDYLMRHHTVSYAHSADLLIKGAGRPNDESTFSNVLGFSYSKLSSSANDIATSRAVSELPGAALEVQKISQMLPGSYYLGDDATEEKFKSQAGNFDILHLAVHGTSDPEKQFSGTLHFKQSPNGQEDGELHVYELYDLALKARLTVISACESGVGKIFRGEGVFSIARGFAYAGCPSTVMTLWPVSDLSSADIMANFYNSLSDGHHIDLALRTAKLDYLKTADPQLAHPFYWAAYIPTGNMEPVIRPPFPLKSMLLAVAVLIGLITYYILKNRAQAHTNRKDLASTTTLE